LRRADAARSLGLNDPPHHAAVAAVAVILCFGRAPHRDRGTNPHHPRAGRINGGPNGSHLKRT
jgi:hypothetical protein